MSNPGKIQSHRLPCIGMTGRAPASSLSGPATVRDRSWVAACSRRDCRRAAGKARGVGPSDGCDRGQTFDRSLSEHRGEWDGWDVRAYLCKYVCARAHARLRTSWPGDRCVWLTGRGCVTTGARSLTFGSRELVAPFYCQQRERDHPSQSSLFQSEPPWCARG